jgi:hypothetical protein
MANDLWLLNDGTSKILLNNGTDRLALNSETAGEVTIDKWHRTGGTIVRAATLAVVGQITFAAIAPDTFHVVAAPDVTVVRPQVRLAPAYARTPYVESGEVVTIDKWHRTGGAYFTKPSIAVIGQITFGAIPPDIFHVVEAPNTSVIFNRTRLAPSYAYAPYVEVAAETVTSDKWGAAVSQPRFVKRVTGEEGSFFFVGDGADRFAWRQPFSRPVLAKPRLEGDYTTAPTQPQANDGIGWHRPFNEPTRRKNFLEADVAYNPALIEDAGIQAKWFQPFGVPRAAKRAPEFPASFYSPYFVPPISGTGTEFNWWPNLSERLRQPRPVAQQQAIIHGPLVPITVTLEYAWHRQLSEPVRRKKEAQSAGAVFNPFPQITIAWHQPLSVPVRDKNFLEGRVAYSPYFVPSLSGVGTEYNWWSSLSERLRQRRPVIQQQAVIHGPPLPITVTLEYAWHRPLSEPTRRKLSRASVPFIAFGRQPETGSADGIASAMFSGPIFRRHLISQTLAYTPPALFPYAWHRSLSDPTRRRPNPGLFGPIPFVYVPAQAGVGVGTDQPWPEWSRPTRRITIQHLRAGVMWTSSFVLASYDPDRVVCVHFESRSVDIEALSRTVTPNQSRTVTVEGTARTVEPDEQSRSVTPDERQSCQES